MTLINLTTRNARPKKQVEVIKLPETRDGRGRTTHWAVSNDGWCIVFRSTDGRWVQHEGPWLGVPAVVREAICSIQFEWKID